MSRLIDADALKKRWIIASPFPYRTDTVEVLDSIDDMPTVFDKDKVVEQLEDFREEMKRFGCDGILTDIIDVVERGGAE